MHKWRTAAFKHLINLELLSLFDLERLCVYMYAQKMRHENTARKVPRGVYKMLEDLHLLCLLS